MGIEPSAHVQPLQAVMVIPIVGSGEHHLHQIRAVADQRGDQFGERQPFLTVAGGGTLGPDRQ
jgi:hypothetical protein